MGQGCSEKGASQEGSEVNIVRKETLESESRIDDSDLAPSAEEFSALSNQVVSLVREKAHLEQQLHESMKEMEILRAKIGESAIGIGVATTKEDDVTLPLTPHAIRGLGLIFALPSQESREESSSLESVTQTIIAKLSLRLKLSDEQLTSVRQLLDSYQPNASMHRQIMDCLNSADKVTLERFAMTAMVYGAVVSSGRDTSLRAVDFSKIQSLMHFFGYTQRMLQRTIDTVRMEIVFADKANKIASLS